MTNEQQVDNLVQLLDGYSKKRRPPFKRKCIQS